MHLALSSVIEETCPTLVVHPWGLHADRSHAKKPMPMAHIHPLSRNMCAAPFHVALGGWVLSPEKVKA